MGYIVWYRGLLTASYSTCSSIIFKENHFVLSIYIYIFFTHVPHPSSNMAFRGSVIASTHITLILRYTPKHNIYYHWICHFPVISFLMECYLYSTYNGWFRNVQSLVGWAYQLLPSSVTIITKQNFRDKVLRSEDPWVVDFYAPWCGPCQAYMPNFEEIAKVRMIKEYTIAAVLWLFIP